MRVRVHTATLAGGSTNADRVFVTDHAVIVLDGASAFSHVDQDPGVYAGALGVQIAEQLDARGAADLADVVAEAIRRAVTQLGLCAERSPSSTVSILRARNGETDLYVLGDSPIFYGTASTTFRLEDLRLAALARDERQSYVNRLRSGHGYDAHHRTALRAMQQAQRGYRNTEAGYWIAETNPDAAGHALARTVTEDELTWAVLATDGVTEVLEHLAKPDWARIARYDGTRLAELLRRIHQWEETRDPDGRRLPRAKQHDDKTIAAVTVD